MGERAGAALQTTQALTRMSSACGGYLQCERCKLIPSQALGPHGDAVVEVHHAGIAVSDMEPGQITRLADLMCLCANCHRIVHRETRAVTTTVAAA